MRKTLLATAVLAVAALARAGGVEISGAVIGETPPGQTVAGAHFTITNNNGVDCVLTGAASDVSPRVELHGHSHQDGVMRMRPLASLPVAGGATLDSRTQGFHLMLHDLDDGVTAGETLDIRLDFGDCGMVAVPFRVQSPHQHH